MPKKGNPKKGTPGRRSPLRGDFHSAHPVPHPAGSFAVQIGFLPICPPSAIVCGVGSTRHPVATSLSRPSMAGSPPKTIAPVGCFRGRNSAAELRQRKNKAKTTMMSARCFPLGAAERSVPFVWSGGQGWPTEVRRHRMWRRTDPQKGCVARGVSGRRPETCGWGRTFFGYFLCASKESNAPPAGATQAGGEPAPSAPTRPTPG